MITKANPSINYSYLGIAAIFGFLGFMMEPTAYTWGEQDMMPFFERVFDPNFLTNDFFTNTTVVKNPRWVYGYFIVAISSITTLPWYTVLYIMKLILLIFSPVIYFRVLIVLLRRYVREIVLIRLYPFVLICLVLMVFLKDFRDYFSVASWWSYSPALHAYNISTILGFIAILLKERGNRMLWYLPFFFLSCFVHPAMGLFCIAFYGVLLTPDFSKELKHFLPVLAIGIIAVVLVKLLFATQQSLPTSEFIDIYVKERHSWHYSVPDYINRKGDWRIFFTLMNILFMIPFIYGVLQKRKTLRLLALSTWFSYSGAIAAQYFFIDVIPIKLIAYLGISRYTTFGYWMLIVLWSTFLSYFLNKKKAPVLPTLGGKNFAILIINLIFVGIIFIDDPKEVHYNNQKAYFDFVRSTPKDAIFITHTRPMNTDMRIIGQRGVLISDEFPFTEQSIGEYGDRWKLVYGSRKKGNNPRAFYRGLGPKDFNKIAKKYRLDYVVVENGHVDQFSDVQPVWQNGRYSIYSIKNLRN